MGQVLSQPISNELHQRKGNKLFKVGNSEMQGFRMNMEDEHTVDLDLAGKGLAYFGVYDGHAGKKASEFLCAEMSKRVGALQDPTNDEQLLECVQKADADFIAREDEREDGSTCCFTVVKPFTKDGKQAWEVIAVNVGDSRAMIIRAEDGKCEALTEDHKPEDPRESKRIEQAHGHVHMNRVDGQLAMSRAIGDYQYKRDPKLPADEQKVIAVPEIQRGVAYENDLLLVCCDGIVEAMSNEDAAECCYEGVFKTGDDFKNADLAKVCSDLFKLSLKKGSKDNHSAILIQFTDGTAYQRADQFVAGPFHPFQNDKQYVKAYLADALKHGYEGEELMKLAKETEDTMPELKDQEQNVEEGSGFGVNALQAFLGAQTGGDMQEKLLMLTQMFGQKGGMGGDEDDEGDDEPHT